MGFPRIISKNNKIYTKLGEFCLSCDGSNFWIICHTCQEELQTQDHFWKHIQDEHNFLHSLSKENNRIASAPVGGMPDAASDTSNVMPLPLYRKIHDEETRAGSVGNNDEDSQELPESKHYTEMRGMDSSDAEIEIKIEPSSLSQQQAQQIAGTNDAAQTLYQLPQHVALNTNYSTVVHALPTLAMPGLAPLAPPPLLPYDLQQAQTQAQQQQQQQQQLQNIKDVKCTTASASSAVSSDDGERWYICDFDSCGVKFKYQSRLELHRSVHSKERRFSCDFCGASFKQSCNLSTHRKKKHFLKSSRATMNAHVNLGASIQVSAASSPPQQLQQQTQSQQQ